MGILLLTASVRKESFNKKLSNIVLDILSQQSKSIERLQPEDWLFPLYNGDVEVTQGLPDKAKKLVDRLRQASALIIVTPEYNYSIPGTLKNTLDWVSRARPMPLVGLPVLLLSASPALAGGSRGLLQVRIPLEICAAHVFPSSFSLAQADEAFDSRGQLKNDSLHQQLVKLLDRFSRFSEKIKDRK